MWTLIIAGAEGANAGNALKQYMLDAETDIQTPPTGTSIAPGSMAYLPDYSKIWVKDRAGVWHQL